MKNILFILFILSACSNSFAQDYHFSQYTSNPVFLNPGLAGSDSCPRLVVNSRLQWGNLSNGYKTFSASYDQYVPKLNGGLALSYVCDNAMGILFTNNLNLSYAYKIKLSDAVFVSPAIIIGMGAKSLDEKELNISSDYNPRIYFNSGAGLLISYKRISLGITADHLNKPNESFLNTETAKLPIKYIAFASTQFHLSNELILNPSIMYEKHEMFEEMVPSLSLLFHRIRIGAAIRVGFENPDCIIGMLGYQSFRFFAGYSYDYTISKLANATGGSHEIALIYLLKKRITSSKFKSQLIKPHYFSTTKRR